MIQNEICYRVGVACIFVLKRSLTSLANTMVVIKELRWLAAAGECGRAATNQRLLTSDESLEVKVNETTVWTCTCLVYYTINVVVASIVE